MSLAFRRVTVPIPKSRIRQRIPTEVEFASNVRRLDVALNGLKLDDENLEGDRSLNVVEVDTDIDGLPNGRKVTFVVETRPADKNFDDDQRGYVTALLIAGRRLRASLEP